MSKLCFVGIGNPGLKYNDTKHNVGKDWLIKLSNYYNVDFLYKEKVDAKLASSHNDEVKWVIPSNYVNNTGETVKKILRYSNLTNENIVVLHDDLDLNPGEIKIKLGGGHGGHNGLRDIFKKIGTKDFYRIRIGIGHPGNKDDVTDWVLTKFKSNDKKVLDDSFINLINVFDLICENKFNEAQLKLHS